MKKETYAKAYVKPAKSFAELNDRLINSFAGIKKDITALREQNALTQKRFIELQEKIEGFSKDFVSIDKFNVLKIKIAEVQESLKQIWAIDKQVSELNEITVKIPDFEKQISLWTNDITKLRVDLEEVESKKVNKEQIRKLTDDINQEFDHLKDLFEEVRNTKDSARKFKKQLESIKEDVDVLSKKHKELKKEKVSQETLTKLTKAINAEFEDIKEIIEELRVETALKKEVVALAKKQKQYAQKTQKSIEELKKKQAEQSHQIAQQLRKEIEHTQEKVAALRKEVSKNQSWVSKSFSDLKKETVSKKEAKKLIESLHSDLESAQSYVDSRTQQFEKKIKKALESLKKKELKAAKRHKEFFRKDEAKKLEEKINSDIEAIYSAFEEDERRRKRDLLAVVQTLREESERIKKISKTFFSKKEAQKLQEALNKELSDLYATLEKDEKKRKELIQNALARVNEQELRARKRHKNYLTVKEAKKQNARISKEFENLRERIALTQKELIDLEHSSVTKKEYGKHVDSAKKDIDRLKKELVHLQRELAFEGKELRSTLKKQEKALLSKIKKEYLHIDQAEALVEDINKEFTNTQDQFKQSFSRISSIEDTLKEQKKAQSLARKEQEALKKQLAKALDGISALQEEVKSLKVNFVSQTRFQKTLKYFKKYIKELEKEAVEEDRFNQLFKEVRNLKKEGFRKASITHRTKKEVGALVDSTTTKKKSSLNKEFKNLFKRKISENANTSLAARVFRLANILIFLAFALLIASIALFFAGKIILTDRFALISVICFVVGILLRLFTIGKVQKSKAQK